MQDLISGKNKVKAAIIFGSLFFLMIVFKILFDMAFYEVVENKRLELYDTAHCFKEQIEDRAETAQALIAEVDFQSDHPDKILQVLQSLKKIGFFRLAVFDSDGALIVKTIPDSEPEEVDDQYAFVCALQGKVMISARNALDRRPYIIFYIPYLIHGSGNTGAMIARMNSTEVHNLLQKSIVGAESYDFILDLEGQPVHDCIALKKQSFNFQSDTDDSKRPNDFLLQSLFYGVDMVYFHVNLENSSWRVVKVIPVISIYLEILGTWALQAGLLFMGACIAGLGSISAFREWKTWKRSERNKVKSLTVAAQTAAGIAHEIKNPLTSIKGFLSLMIRKENPVFIRKNLPIIMEEVERIESLSNQFCMLARPREKDTHGEVNLMEVFREILDFIRPLAIEKGVYFHCDADFQKDEASLCLIHGSANQIKQVLLNILKNAVEATACGGEVWAALYKTDKMYCIRIKDTGIGINPQDLEKIGTPFYSTKETGTGLGLLVSFEIVHRHGGEIELQSAVGYGTEFVIKLPIYGE